MVPPTAANSRTRWSRGKRLAVTGDRSRSGMCCPVPGQGRCGAPAACLEYPSRNDGRRPDICRFRFTVQGGPGTGQAVSLRYTARPPALAERLYTRQQRILAAGMSARSLYKVIFVSQGKVYEIYARSVTQGTLFGFIEVERLVFGERSTVVVDPSEERIKSEFAGVRRTYLPMHSILRIDEVEKQGVSKISDRTKAATSASFPRRSTRRAVRRLASDGRQPQPPGRCPARTSGLAVRALSGVSARQAAAGGSRPACRRSAGSSPAMMH